MKVKDFSTGKEVRFACPECGYDLRPLNAGKGLKETTLQSEPESEIKHSVSKPIEAMESTVNGGINESKTTVPTHLKFKSEQNPATQSTVQTANQPHIAKDTTINGVGAKEERGRLTCRTCKKESRTPLFTLEYAASTHALGYADLSNATLRSANITRAK
jgi:uncharacterized Zn finger protein (UPF0148 family)